MHYLKYLCLLCGFSIYAGEVAVPLTRIPARDSSITIGATTTTFDHDLYVSTTEITQDQYTALLGTNPSKYTGDGSNPVESVSWYDAVRFCMKMNEMEHLENPFDTTMGEPWWNCDPTRNGYRLLTQAEWEYASRGGTPTLFYWGDSQADSTIGLYAWFEKNANSSLWEEPHAAEKGPQKTAMLLANPFGLFDMIGNVGEWTDSWYAGYAGAYRVIRGGSWYSTSRQLSNQYRSDVASPSTKTEIIGFRIVRNAEDATIIERKPMHPKQSILFMKNGEFHITSSEQVCSVRIEDIRGRTLYTGTELPSGKQWSSGVYIVDIAVKSGRTIEKIKCP